MVFRQAALLLLLLDASPTVRAEERRIALVIGNDNYPSMPLRAAKNDARAVRSALVEAGFSVDIVEDADRVTFERAVSDFASKIQTGDIALFYYSGRATSVDGANAADQLLSAPELSSRSGSNEVGETQGRPD
jgi:hypothetical protein